MADNGPPAQPKGRLTMRCTTISIALAVLVLVATVATAGAQDNTAKGFTDHGVGAEVAELRGLTPAVTKDGRNLLICSPTDEAPIGYLLVTDIDTGKTEQYFCPEDVRQYDPFGALLHSNGKYYHTQSRTLLEFDPETCKFTWYGIPSKQTGVYLCFTEAPDGTIWAGGVYNSGLISFNPETKEMKDHGRMDPKEIYLSFLATDDKGWVYCGIGTARCNIIAYNPATGEKRSLIAEDKRVTGSGSVNPGADGTAYGVAAGQYYRLLDGAATPIEKAQAGPKRKLTDLRYGTRYNTFPDGRQVTHYDLAGKTIKIYDPKTKQTKTIPFEYKSGGVTITSLGAGPEGIVYGSTCHPMNMLALDTRTGILTDMGHIPQCGGGNFCAIATQGDQVIGAQYSAGRLWAYDVNEPWNPQGGKPTFGLDAQELIKCGEVKDGHFTYLQGHNLAFVCGDKWGAQATFKLQAPADGDYYLYIAPYRHYNYCTIQFLFDGKKIGEPYEAASSVTKAGQVLEFGPIALKAGEHALAARTIETKGQEPFFGILCAELTQKRHEATTAAAVQNPRILGQWKRDVCRPRTALAHPDGKHVMMAGYAGYGLCGGGIAIVNLETGEDTLLTAENDLLPSHSCITLKALPNGDLVGGTTIGAPGGGHVTATEGHLFIVDWETKKVTFQMVPVPGDKTIKSIYVLDDGLVYGLSSNSTFFVFDPKKQEIVHSESFREYGGVPRHALQVGPDGKLYAMMTSAILRITPGTLEHEKLTDTPVPISGGGALVNGLLVFANSSHVWSYKVPDL